MPENSVVFDRAAEYYDETRGFPPGEDLLVGAFIAQNAKLTRTHQLLEIGVGTGRIALPTAQHTGRFVGVDLSIPMLERLQQKHRDYPAARINMIQGDVMRLPLASHQFDAALIVHILHLIPDSTLAAQELARVLKPEGKALQCWNDRDDTPFQPLWDAWKTTTEGGESQDKSWQTGKSTLKDLGWRLQGEYVYDFTLRQSPYEAADSFRQRRWSRLWHLPDDLWRSGVDAIEAVLQNHYGSTQHQPIAVPCRFVIKNRRKTPSFSYGDIRCVVYVARFCIGNGRTQFATPPHFGLSYKYSGASLYTVSVKRRPVRKVRHLALTAEAPAFRHGEYVTNVYLPPAD